MITLDNVSYSYRKGGAALSGINCRVGAGIHLLMGENGAGKTTLLHLMAGLRRPTQGSCELDGSPLFRRRPSDMCRVQLMGAT